MTEPQMIEPRAEPVVRFVTDGPVARITLNWPTPTATSGPSC
jgi:hypothetical protein